MGLGVKYKTTIMTVPPPPHTILRHQLQEYFNTEGFQRWNRIYSDTAEVNKVQADIRCVRQIGMEYRKGREPSVLCVSSTCLEPTPSHLHTTIHTHPSVGHQQTVDKILAWLEADGVKGETICDAGCGVGSLAIPMAMLGAKVGKWSMSCHCIICDVWDGTTRLFASKFHARSCLPYRPTTYTPS